MAAIAEMSEKHPLVKLRDQLDSREQELANALPPHISTTRFKRVFLTTVQTNPDLLTVDRQSLWNALMKAASDGLYPDSREAVILPFRSKDRGMIAQYLPMIGGLLKRFRNSGQYKSIMANVVLEGEFFEHWYDENGAHLKHIPGDGHGAFVKAYAIAKTKDGGTTIRVMGKADIDKRRNVSRAKDGPMWRDWYSEAAMKTVLRSLTKTLPTSSDIDELLERDDDPDAFTEKRAPITSINAALDHFSGQQEGGSAAEQEKQFATEEPVDPGPDEEQAAADAGEEAEQAAFERGKADKLAGRQRRAVPPEYRTPEASTLARAWISGWDEQDNAG